MSTRSIIAVPMDSGFRGRYAHSDGYPSHMAVALLAIVAEHGVEKARQVLVEEADKGGWSEVDPKAAPREWHGNRVETVPGFGNRYLDAGDNWYTQDGEPDTPYAYVLNDTHISIMTATNTSWHLTGEIRWDQPLGDALDKICRDAECGEQLEYCSHYAWVHFPQVGREMTMSTSHWLGKVPLGIQQIEAVIVGGQEVKLGGSARTGSARHPHGDASTTVWYEWRSTDDGRYVRVSRIVKAGHKLCCPAKMPATATVPAHIVPAGTVLAH